MKTIIRIFPKGSFLPGSLKNDATYWRKVYEVSFIRHLSIFEVIRKGM
jgi:hypothetical protein